MHGASPFKHARLKLTATVPALHGARLVVGGRIPLVGEGASDLDPISAIMDILKYDLTFQGDMKMAKALYLTGFHVGFYGDPDDDVSNHALVLTLQTENTTSNFLIDRAGGQKMAEAFLSHIASRSVDEGDILTALAEVRKRLESLIPDVEWT